MKLLELAIGIGGLAIGFFLGALFEMHEVHGPIEHHVYQCSIDASQYLGDDGRGQKIRYQLAIAGPANEIGNPEGLDGWQCKLVI